MTGLSPVGSGTRESDYLRTCLRLAWRARGATSPNPMVGSVVVHDERIVGRGYHRAAGGPHAERLALEQAGAEARGATLYTNMEPCCHQGRTPPCTQAIIEAGIERVVASQGDPDRRVNGQGFRALRDAGIIVDEGRLAGEAARLNEAYLAFKETGRPFVLAKAAVSLDGRLATRDRVSQWITGRRARRRSHRLRAQADAVLVGVGTVLDDDPRLTARGMCSRQGPRYRVVLDSNLRTPPRCRLLVEPGGGVLIFATETAPSSARGPLEEAGAEVVIVAADPEGRVSWDAVLAALAARDTMCLMIEGGSAVLTSAFEAGIIDKLFLVYGPMLIGGSTALPLWGGRGVSDLRMAPRLHSVRRYDLGDDWAIEGYLRGPTAAKRK